MIYLSIVIWNAYQTKQSQRWNLFWLFWKVREIGPPFSAEASCQVEGIWGQNEAFTFDLTNVERWPRSNFLDHFHHSQIVTFWFMAHFIILILQTLQVWANFSRKHRAYTAHTPRIHRTHIFYYKSKTKRVSNTKFSECNKELWPSMPITVWHSYLN